MNKTISVFLYVQVLPQKIQQVAHDLAVIRGGQFICYEQYTEFAHAYFDKGDVYAGKVQC